MYIQEVNIEGFKSYAQRVVLPNFDPTFNAITGLNGTGKSNILDSICFVMGIKNLSQVSQRPAVTPILSSIHSMHHRSVPPASRS
jgi:chromosome segregation ATPase